MKKIISILCIGILSAIFLAGCARSDQSGVDKNGIVNIQYWHTQTEEERVEQLKSLIQSFEAKNPGIRVQQVPVPEENFPSKISAAMGADRLPALIEGGIDQMLFLGAEEVTDNAAHQAIIKQLGPDTFYTGALNTMRTTDQQGYYGVPISGWVQGIWYNEKLFKEKGLQPPSTWDNILKAAQTIHNPAKQQYGIVIGTTKDDFAEQTFSQFALSNNAQVFNDKGEVNFNSPEMKETLEYYNKLSKFTPSGAESWREARELFLSGRAPMVMYSSYLMGDLAANKDLVKQTRFTVPEKKSAATFGQITSVSIMNTISPQQSEAAKKFTMFLMEKETNIKYLHMSPGGANPTRKIVAADPAYLQNEVLQAFGSEAVRIAASLNDLKRFGFEKGRIEPAMGDISAQFIIGEAINQITEGRSSVNAAADNAQGQMLKIAKRAH
ncbi:ABC transporter substrate-binding protein [Paenibacillus gansuensis]|uniref:ABC transporter substrate-binding protein n=1 Tax=Paenibacillus gansuensis TaxID=306542 RepID=A0ABW5PBU4_9BACL